MLNRYMNEQFQWHRYQLLIYALGVTMFAFGARIFIDAGLGTDPLDVMVIGMNKHLNIGLGLCSSLVAVFFLTWWTLWNKKPPPLAPFVTTTAVGFLLDIFGSLGVGHFTVEALSVRAFDTWGTRHDLGPVLAVVPALLLCSYASALIIMSGIGIRIMDLVAITMVERLGWSFFRSKMVLEIGLFSSGWLLGGPIGPTTILFLVFVGPFIQPFMWANHTYLRIPNKGLRQVDLAH